ncbi:MAG: type II toxin-antitoxin system RelE/ParE family toxin [Pseudomonadota bacterium]
MASKTDFHPDALRELQKLDKTILRRIKKAVKGLEALDDPRQRLIPYTETLSGFWKLRVGDYRLICELKRDGDGNFVLIIHVAHRSQVYSRRGQRIVERRSSED